MSATTTDVYDIPQEFKDFRDTIRQIVDGEIAPRAAEIDAKGEYPWDIRKLLAEHDILGLPFGEEYGGTGTGTLMLQIAVEEIAKACASSALILMVQELGTLPITLFGTDEQKERIAAALRDRRVVARVRAVRARGRLGPRRAAHDRGARRRRVGHQRHEELDHERGDRRLLRRLRGHRPREPPAERLRRRGRSRGLHVPQARAQARHQGLADRLAGLRGRARAAREPDRRGGQGPVRRARHAASARASAPRRRPSASRRARPTTPTQYAKERITFGKPINEFQAIAVQARRHGDAHRRRARAALQGVRDGRPQRARPRASTRRWPSCSPPTPRCG